MTWTIWMAAAAALVSVSGAKIDPPPVILDLGRLNPTPAPTPEENQKKRLITVITVRNSAEGESVITFEASDVATGGRERVRTLASKSYALGTDTETPELKQRSAKILHKIRSLERDLLDYAQQAGPPKQAPPLGSGERVQDNRQPE